MKKFLNIMRTQTIRDSLVVFCGLGVTAALGFVYTVIMARNLRPESFGVFSAITSLIAIVYSLGDLGIGPAIINFLPKLKKRESSLLGSTFLLQYFAGIAIALLFWLLAASANYFIPGALAEHFCLISLLSFNYILIGWSQAIFTAQKRFWRLSLSQIVDAIVKILIVLYLFKASKLSISTALMANAISTILALLLTFWKELLAINPKPDREIFAKIYHYSKWIAVSRIFSVFLSRIDIILLNLLASSYSAGIFAAASRITLLFAMIVSSLGSVVNPRFSSFTTKKETIAYIKKLFFLISAISFAVLVSVAFAKPIILFVFGAGFSESIFVFQLLALSMIPFLYSIIFTATILYTFHQTAFYAFTTAIQTLSVIAINLIYIPKVGVFAPVIASAFSNCLIFIISVVKLKHLFKNQDISK